MVCTNSTQDITNAIAQTHHFNSASISPCSKIRYRIQKAASTLLSFTAVTQAKFVLNVGVKRVHIASMHAPITFSLTVVKTQCASLPMFHFRYFTYTSNSTNSLDANAYVIKTHTHTPYRIGACVLWGITSGFMPIVLISNADFS